MPNLTFYISEEKFAQFSNVNNMTQQCLTLCVDMLGAETDKIHIIYISVKSGYGYPIYAALNYRLSDQRTPEVMQSFMQELHHIILQMTGLTARIRCFAAQPIALYAYN